ncbi:iron-containing redox enzyme family protein [Paraburkholderia sp.]|jgi:pyrroloquinoline quinone (PQQ) biosynthesis protein C|uniref:iron-containing redox enzyme family protein n=1 Tax=Paraburkholderia sp. TaxID=1926495 RepID=UPI002F3E33ED
MRDIESSRGLVTPFSSKSLVNQLEGLAQNVYASGALNNDFYELWTSRHLSVRQIAVFARNYGEFNRAFPEVLAVMISSTRDIHAQAEYAKTLYSEMGYGNPDKVHSVLFDAWLAELGERLGDRTSLEWTRLACELPVLPETKALIEGEKRLYGVDNATGAGAQLALEWQAYTMLRKLYDGAALYKSLWQAEDAFHESCEYFYAHIGATEKEHKVESLKAARQFAIDDESFERVQQGFYEHLGLFESFWNAVARAMKAAQQH